jgi:hypothetical protein
MNAKYKGMHFDILNCIAYGVCIVNKDLEVIFWNRVLHDWSGLDYSEISGKSLGEYYPAFKEKYYVNRLNDVLSGSPPALFSPQLHPHIFSFKHSGGGLRILRTMVSKIDVDETTEKLLLFSIDDFTTQSMLLQQITELRKKAIDEIEVRKLTEEALKTSETKFKEHFRAIPIPTYSFERMGDSFVLVDYNEAVIDEVKGKIGKLLGMKADKIYEAVPQIISDLEYCYANKTNLSREIHYTLYTTGEEIYLDIKYAFVSPNYIMLHSENISERKRIEAEKENLIHQLKELLDSIKTLKGLIPICASCKKIRNDQGYWQQVDDYIAQHSEVEFSHGICPDCVRKLYPEISTVKKTPTIIKL